MREISFLQGLNRGLVIAFGVGSALAVLFCFLLSRRIVRPVETITHAARRLESGDLSQRVAISRTDEIGQLAEAFNSMAQALERSQSSRQRMVSDIAHELRTPLSNLRGYLEGLQDGVVRPDKATIEVLYSEAMLLSRLVDDLQELSLAEAGQLTLDPVGNAPADLVRTAVAGAAARARDLGLELTAEVSDDLPPVRADTRRTRQILNNLVGNALAHTPPGGRVVVSATDDGGQVRFSVADTGHGIPAADVPFIFDRFYRADSSRSRATGGSGLGLTITRELVTAQGGRIGVVSQPGAGTTFDFTLPVIDEAPRPVLAGAPARVAAD